MIKSFYAERLRHLETPEFVAWFETWYGDDSPFPPESTDLIERYWSERRFALLGWHAAMLPATVSGNKHAFVQSIQPLHGPSTATVAPQSAPQSGCSSPAPVAGLAVIVAWGRTVKDSLTAAPTQKKPRPSRSQDGAKFTGGEQETIRASDR